MQWPWVNLFLNDISDEEGEDDDDDEDEDDDDEEEEESEEEEEAEDEGLFFSDDAAQSVCIFDWIILLFLMFWTKYALYHSYTLCKHLFTCMYNKYF